MQILGRRGISCSCKRRRFGSSEESNASQLRARDSPHLPFDTLKDAQYLIARERCGAVREESENHEGHASSDPRCFSTTSSSRKSNLKSDNLPDPVDLANLKAVSLGMRDAVVATGRTIEDLDSETAAKLGRLSALQRPKRGGRLSRRKYLCDTAARSGHLEVLKWLRANGCPWDNDTWRYANSDIRDWARENGYLESPVFSDHYSMD